MAYDTNNPVGSTDPRDLYDNAGNLDKFVNGDNPFYPDRLGKQRISWSGMEQDFQNSQDGRQAAFDQFLEASSFVWIGDYAAGLTFTSRSQYMVRDGYAYRLATTTTLPYTTTGNWALEQTKFSLVNSDDVLRQDLSNTVDLAKGAAINGRGVVSVASMYELCQISAYRADLTYNLIAWHTSTVIAKLRGGGQFRYLSGVPKSMHNGATIVSTTVPITADPASTPNFLAGVGETDPGGTGCLVRVYTGDIWVEWFGLLDDSTYNWNCKSFNAAIKWADAVAPDISPGLVRFGDGEFRTTDPVILTRQNGVTGRIPGFRGAGAFNSTIIKTTNNTAGAGYGTYNLDAAVIEIPKSGDDQQIAGANSGSFGLQKLAADRTGYGYYASRSYAGKRTDMMIRDFNYGFSSPGCWDQRVDFIWCLGCNVNFTMSGTSNHGGNLYSGHAYEIGFDLSGLTYSNLSTACDSTGEQGNTPKIGYKLSGSHGLTLHAGAEKNVGKDFEITNSFGVKIGGHCYNTGVSAVTTNKITIAGSTVRFDYDWSLALSNLTTAQKANYPVLYTKDSVSAVKWGVCNFGETDPRMPQVLDGKFLSSIEVSPYSNVNGYVIHQLLLSSSVFKQAVYVGSSPRIKLIYGVCTDTTADTSFEPTVPLGHAVSAISTSSATPTDIGNLYIGGVLNSGRLQGYVSNGWLYLRGPSGQQRVHSLHFITAPQA